MLQPDGKACTIISEVMTITGTSCASGACTSRQLQCRSLISSGTFQTVDACAGTENQCQKLCQTKSGSCLSVAGHFIDGTPCAGGTCQDGDCTVTDPFGVLSYYFEAQPQVAYPIAIALVILIMFMILCCVRCCQSGLDRKKHRSRSRAPPSYSSVFFTTPVNTRSAEQEQDIDDVSSDETLNQQSNENPHTIKLIKNPLIPGSTSTPSRIESMLHEIPVNDDFSLMPESLMGLPAFYEVLDQLSLPGPVILASSTQFGTERGNNDQMTISEAPTIEDHKGYYESITFGQKATESKSETKMKAKMNSLKKEPNPAAVPKSRPSSLIKEGSVPKKGSKVSLKDKAYAQAQEQAYYDRVDFGHVEEIAPDDKKGHNESIGPSESETKKKMKKKASKKTLKPPAVPVKPVEPLGTQL